MTTIENDDWWRGALGDNVGIFPSNRVHKLDDSEIADSNIQLLDVIARVQARWDFIGREEGDLSFKVGDTINVVEYVDGAWWRGTLSGQVGVFPSSYVQKLRPPENGKYPSTVVFARPVAEAPLIDLGVAQQQPSNMYPSPPSKDAYLPHQQPTQLPSFYPPRPSSSSSKDVYIPSHPQQLAQHPSQLHTPESTEPSTMRRPNKASTGSSVHSPTKYAFTATPSTSVPRTHSRDTPRRPTGTSVSSTAPKAGC
ncbi:hypothetical protein BGZ52_004965 [Haplosporangium bisporale]|nr:hypothetical protein BGZ52_004965 [Haplosporangium bisporale]